MQPSIKSTFGNLALAANPFREDIAKRKTALREKSSLEEVLRELWTSKDSNALRNIAVLDGKDVGATLLTKLDSRTPNDPINFTYSANDRLVQATKGLPGSETVLGQFDYNHEGNRIRHRFSDRGDVDYYYDDGAVLEERNAADDSLLAYYQYADRLIALAQPLGTQYYHHDALGSTIGLTDHNGADKKSYHLDPWGNIRWETGSSDNRHIFTGKDHDKNTGLVYFGARYYDPEIGRFITQDTYLGEQNQPPSLHRYLYAHSNPTVFIDLQGYQAAEAAKLLIGPAEGYSPVEGLESPIVEPDGGNTAASATTNAKSLDEQLESEPDLTTEDHSGEFGDGLDYPFLVGKIGSLWQKALRAGKHKEASYWQGLYESYSGEYKAKLPDVATEVASKIKRFAIQIDRSTGELVHSVLSGEFLESLWEHEVKPWIEDPEGAGARFVTNLWNAPKNVGNFILHATPEDWARVTVFVGAAYATGTFARGLVPPGVAPTIEFAEGYPEAPVVSPRIRLGRLVTEETGSIPGRTIKTPPTVSRVIHASRIAELGAQEGTVVLGHYTRPIVVGGQTYLQETLPILESAAKLLGGRTLSSLPRDIGLISPELHSASRIVFYTSTNMQATTAAEMALIQSDPALLAKTVFVYGGF